MKSIYLSILLVTLTISSAYGNGGPIDGSSVYSVGDIVLINKPQIALLNEDLSIRFDGDFANVRVVYTLKNQGESAEMITYGFPVTFSRNEFAYDMKWDEKNVPEISFQLDGESLDIVHKLDEATRSLNHVDYGEIDAKSKWYIVEFNLPREELSTLIVTYRVKTSFQDWATTKSFFPGYSPRQFLYEFSPAQNWGNGVIDEMTLEIDARDIVDNQGTIEIEGLDLAEYNGQFSGIYKNFDLKSAENLIISYKIDLVKQSDYVKSHLVAKDLIKTISATSTLGPNYVPANMLDMDFNTAWVEGVEGHGIGESITIELDDYPLSTISLINGYYKSEGTFITNSRIKKLEMKTAFVNYQDSSKVDIETEVIELRKVPFRMLNVNNFYGAMSVLGNYGDGFRNVRTITITILEVEEGTKYEDTCLTEVILTGYL